MKRVRANVVMGACLAAVVPSPGCRTIQESSPYMPLSEQARDPSRAQKLNTRAAELMDSDPDRAETLLREALAADLYCGPAHNNLGVLYLSMGKLYEAAGEFEWAKKLLPGHPDPRLNLALTLERAGRIDEAIAGYHAALEVYPEHLPTLQALARCQMRYGRSDVDTPDLLELIALRSDDRWRNWARTQAMRMAE